MHLVWLAQMWQLDGSKVLGNATTLEQDSLVNGMSICIGGICYSRYWYWQVASGTKHRGEKGPEISLAAYM